MKQAKLFLISLMLLLSLSLTSANLGSKLAACFPFDSDYNDDVYGITGTEHCDTLCVGYSPNLDSTTSKIGSSLNLTYDSSLTSYTDYVGTATTFYPIDNKNRSVSFWMRIPSVPSYSVWYAETGGNDEGLTLSGSSPYNASFQLGGQSSIISGSATSINTWYHYVIANNRSNNRTTYYRDGARLGSRVFTAKTSAITEFDFGSRGEFGSRADDYVGWIDEFKSWNKTLTQADVTTDYNSGAGRSCSYAITDTGNPTITVITDMVTDLNYPSSSLFIKYNGTLVSTSYNIFNCTLKVNNVINMTDNNVNVSLDQNFTINFGTAVEKDFYMNITCINGDQQLNDTSNNYLYRADTINPIISTSFVNNSRFWKGVNTKVQVNVTYSDTNLYAQNTTICSVSGSSCVTVYNKSFAQGLAPTSRLVGLNHYVHNLSNGRYMVNMQVWDSHTTLAIDDYTLDPISTEALKGVEIENAITLTSTDITTLTLEKNIDRYSYDVDLKIPSDKLTFNLKSTGKLDYIESSNYLGHFVDFANNKWIDFENSEASSVDYVKISDNEYDVIVNFKNLESSTTFNSIGDLNYVNKKYYFNITSGFTFYARNVLTNALLTNYTIRVYNATSYALLQTKTVTNLYNLSFNLTGFSYYTNISKTGYVANNTVAIPFTSGSTFTYRIAPENSLIFYFYDEETDSLINDRNVSYYIINLLNSSYYNRTDTGTDYVTGFATGTYEIQYYAGGYRSNSYFTTITSSSTQTLDLYLVKNASSSLIVFNLVDEKGNPIYNATLKRKRYLFADNAYILVGMAKTDSNGETAMYLVPNDVYYQFVVDRGTTTIFSGTEQKIFSSTVYFRVPLLDDELQSFENIITTTSSSMVYNNNTRILSFTWNDPTGLVLNGCLRVTKKIGLQKTDIGNTCTVSNSATVTFNMTNYLSNDTTYDAYGILTTNTTHSTYPVRVLLDFWRNNKPWNIFGKYGLFLSYIFIASMFFLGLPFNFSIALIYSVLSMFLLSVLGLTFFGGGFVIGVCVVGLIVAVVYKI